MRRKEPTTDTEVQLIGLVRMNPRVDRYAQLYPSLLPRVQQMLNARDPKLREKLEALGRALLQGEAQEGARIAQRFGLTPAQMRVALHIAGRGTVAQYAEKTGVSEQTVRTHLKAIFAKTGVSRQAELARLLLRG